MIVTRHWARTSWWLWRYGSLHITGCTIIIISAITIIINMMSIIAIIIIAINIITEYKGYAHEESTYFTVLTIASKS